MESIDIETWSRRDIYNHYKNVSHPFYLVSFRIDVSNVYQFVKKNDLSFYMAMVYLCTKAINSVENFHYTIQNGEVYRFDRRDPSFCDLHSGSDAFYIVTLKMQEDIIAFCKEAKSKSENQKVFIDPALECDYLIYYSCLPWMDTTAISNERDENDPHFSDDTVPRINWGKYVEENGKKMLGISIEVNHKVIDGYHLGLFVQALEKYISEL